MKPGIQLVRRIRTVMLMVPACPESGFWDVAVGVLPETPEGLTGGGLSPWS